MGKRKLNAKSLEKKKQLQQEKDAELLNGVFNTRNDDLVDNDEPPHDWDNEEMDYELQPRQVKKQKKMIESLPIKRSDGTLERVVREVEEEQSEDDQIEDDEPSNQDNHKVEIEKEDDDEYADLPPQEKLAKLKEEIAELASKLMEDPEENISCLTRLRKMSESKNFMTSQLTILSLIPIYKSLAPSYKIRALTETEKREKVTKEVARLRNFEQGLIFNYKAYIDLISKYSKVSYSNSENNSKITSDQLKRGNLAIKAANELCSSSLRHFNYRDEIFTIICKRLNRKPTNDEDLQVFTKSIRILENLLLEDTEHGDITNDLIKIMCKTIKEKKFRVDESVINIFLSTSLLEDYDPNNNKEVDKPKLKKKDRVHISKKERKARKERKEIEEEMRKAQQAITVEEREKYQSQTLKAILTLYLEILKAGSAYENGKNDATNLIGSVLEGLSKFGQMSNLDLLGDFLTVLKEIMRDIIEEHNQEGGLYQNKEVRTLLLCICTSFSLTLNHQSLGKLPFSIDLNEFVSVLYQIITDLSLDADLEFNNKTLRLVDPLNQLEKPSVNVNTKAELLIRCLDFIFFRSKNSANRASSFVKRIYILLLNTPEKTSLASLKFVGKLLTRYDGLKSLYNNDEQGEGHYQLGIEPGLQNRVIDLERSNPGAATLWESVLLDKHFSPMVRDGSRSLLKNAKSK